MIYCFIMAVNELIGSNIQEKIKRKVLAWFCLAVLLLGSYNIFETSCYEVEVCDGEKSTRSVRLIGSRTVGEALSKAGIRLSASDTISVPLDEKVSGGEIIKIKRNALNEIPTQAAEVMSDKILTANLARYEDYKAREAAILLAEQRTQWFYYSGDSPSTAVFNPDGTVTTSSGTYTVAAEITMEATGYCPCPICCGEYASGYTADGSKATAGYTVAASSDYAFGTLFYIPYFDRVFEVEDRGGAIGGNRIDVYFDTHEEALMFGRRTFTVFMVY